MLKVSIKVNIDVDVDDDTSSSWKCGSLIVNVDPPAMLEVSTGPPICVQKISPVSSIELKHRFQHLLCKLSQYIWQKFFLFCEKNGFFTFLELFKYILRL
jgi:hypothetical protein